MFNASQMMKERRSMRTGRLTRRRQKKKSRKGDGKKSKREKKTQRHCRAASTSITKSIDRRSPKFRQKRTWGAEEASIERGGHPSLRGGEKAKRGDFVRGGATPRLQGRVNGRER